jgi:hypothetical protein
MGAGCTSTGGGWWWAGAVFSGAGLCLVMQGWWWYDWSKQPVFGCNGCCLLCSSRLLGSANKLYSTAAFSSLLSLQGALSHWASAHTTWLTTEAGVFDAPQLCRRPFAALGVCVLDLAEVLVTDRDKLGLQSGSKNLVETHLHTEDTSTLPLPTAALLTVCIRLATTSTRKLQQKTQTRRQHIRLHTCAAICCFC